jgi:hypothetical protein
MAKLLAQTCGKPDHEGYAGLCLQAISRVRTDVDENLRLYVLIDFAPCDWKVQLLLGPRALARKAPPYSIFILCDLSRLSVVVRAARSFRPAVPVLVFPAQGLLR